VYLSQKIFNLLTFFKKFIFSSIDNAMNDHHYLAFFSSQSFNNTAQLVGLAESMRRNQIEGHRIGQLTLNRARQVLSDLELTRHNIERAKSVICAIIENHENGQPL